MRTDAEKQQLFKNVFESCSRRVYSVAFSYMKNRSDSNDVMQEVFLKYYKNMDKLSDCGHIKPWLITVTSNICKNTLRSSWFTRIVSEDDLDTVPYEEDFGEESDLFRSVMRLPEKERVPLHLFYYENFSTSEIARMLGVKESTVRVRMMRGREKLKKLYKEESV